MLSVEWNASGFCLSIPSTIEIVSSCFIVSEAGVLNGSSVLAEQCGCCGDQTFRAYCALSRTVPPPKENQKILPQKNTKKLPHDNQNIPKPGSVPAGKGRRKGQSVTIESEAVRSARPAPV